MQFFPNDEEGCYDVIREKNETYIPKKGVEGTHTRLISSSWPVLVTFPTTDINPGVEYEVEWELGDGFYLGGKIWHICDNESFDREYTIWEEGKGIIEQV